MKLGAQWAVGATRCDDKCVKTVLLETQGPCGSVRRCSDDTETHDTSVQHRREEGVVLILKGKGQGGVGVWGVVAGKGRWVECVWWWDGVDFFLKSCHVVLCNVMV